MSGCAATGDVLVATGAWDRRDGVARWNLREAIGDSLVDLWIPASGPAFVQAIRIPIGRNSENTDSE